MNLNPETLTIFKMIKSLYYEDKMELMFFKSFQWLKRLTFSRSGYLNACFYQTMLGRVLINEACF